MKFFALLTLSLFTFASNAGSSNTAKHSKEAAPSIIQAGVVVGTTYWVRSGGLNGCQILSSAGSGQTCHCVTGGRFTVLKYTDPSHVLVSYNSPSAGKAGECAKDTRTELLASAFASLTNADKNSQMANASQSDEFAIATRSRPQSSQEAVVSTGASH